MHYKCAWFQERSVLVSDRMACMAQSLRLTICVHGALKVIQIELGYFSESVKNNRNMIIRVQL